MIPPAAYFALCCCCYYGSIACACCHQQHPRCLEERLGGRAARCLGVNSGRRVVYRGPEGLIVSAPEPGETSAGLCCRVAGCCTLCLERCDTEGERSFREGVRRDYAERRRRQLLEVNNNNAGVSCQSRPEQPFFGFSRPEQRFREPRVESEGAGGCFPQHLTLR